MKTVDIGLAQLAMHSVYETQVAKDTESLVKAATVLFLHSLQAHWQINVNIKIQEIRSEQKSSVF